MRDRKMANAVRKAKIGRYAVRKGEGCVTVMYMTDPCSRFMDDSIPVTSPFYNQTHVCN